ncbi:MAG: DUF4388 domain-containing protein [Candidatus Hatepunaea meridiana]|nr:DUF4388 domain-containing protein [Candidatus Hatepunaea meridiana]
MKDKSVKILILDDSQEISEEICNYFSTQDSGIIPLATTDPNQVKSILAENKDIKLILCDFYQPGMSSIDLLLSVREEFTDVLFIMLTGCDTCELNGIEKKDASVRVYKKPFNIGELTRLINEVLVDTSPGFDGVIESVEMADIIQLVGLGQRTVELRLTTGIGTGSVFFENGEVIHAVYEDLEGEEAFYEIFNWMGGQFSISKLTAIPERTIEQSWQGLALEATHRQDEARIAADRELGFDLDLPIETKPDDMVIETDDDLKELFEQDEKPTEASSVSVPACDEDQLDTQDEQPEIAEDTESSFDIDQMIEEELIDMDIETDEDLEKLFKEDEKPTEASSVSVPACDEDQLDTQDEQSEIAEDTESDFDIDQPIEAELEDMVIETDEDQFDLHDEQPEIFEESSEEDTLVELQVETPVEEVDSKDNESNVNHGGLTIDDTAVDPLRLTEAKSEAEVQPVKPDDTELEKETESFDDALSVLSQLYNREYENQQDDSDSNSVIEVDFSEDRDVYDCFAKSDIEENNYPKLDEQMEKPEKQPVLTDDSQKDEVETLRQVLTTDATPNMSSHDSPTKELHRIEKSPVSTTDSTTEVEAKMDIEPDSAKIPVAQPSFQDLSEKAFLPDAVKPMPILDTVSHPETPGLSDSSASPLDPVDHTLLSESSAPPPASVDHQEPSEQPDSTDQLPPPDVNDYKNDIEPVIKEPEPVPGESPASQTIPEFRDGLLDETIMSVEADRVIDHYFNYFPSTQDKVITGLLPLDTLPVNIRNYFQFTFQQYLLKVINYDGTPFDFTNEKVVLSVQKLLTVIYSTWEVPRDTYYEVLINAVNYELARYIDPVESAVDILFTNSNGVISDIKQVVNNLIVSELMDKCFHYLIDDLDKYIDHSINYDTLRRSCKEAILSIDEDQRYQSVRNAMQRIFDIITAGTGISYRYLCYGIVKDMLDAYGLPQIASYIESVGDGGQKVFNVTDLDRSLENFRLPD